MKKPNVYFISSRATVQKSPADKLQKLVESAGLNPYKENRTVAIKIHFGEGGATGYIHPSYARTIVNMLKQRGCKPFLTDTNTLYHGSRSNGVDHTELAIANGFNYAVVNAPVVIADGIKSKSVKELPAGPQHFKTVKIGTAIWESDCLITLNHFKGHMVTSFGGAIKNLSMGIGSRATKQRMHADVKPELKTSLCIGCGECREVCPVDAISIEKKFARFRHKICIGCAECISACSQGAIKIQWSGSSRAVQEKMAEVAMAVTRHFKNRCLHINFLLNITPECDCLYWTDHPIVQDIGIIASYDPVAADQASLDQVRKVPGLSNSALPEGDHRNVDKFTLIHPNVDPDAQLDYGEQIGLGTRAYQLIEL